MTTPLFFFTLCLAWAGGEDCSYNYHVIHDKAQFEVMFVTASGSSDEYKIKNTVGFVNHVTKNIYLYNWKFITQALVHETKHVECALLYEPGYQRDKCDLKVHIDQRQSDLERQMEEECTWCIAKTPKENPKQAFCKISGLCYR